MLVRRALLPALAALCCAAPVVAATGEPAPRAEPSKDDSDVVCEVQRVTGSRPNSKRVCLTRAQWREQKRALQQELNSVQRPRPGAGGN
jgi:hypothetical protein